jgi:hypothetical protein
MLIVALALSFSGRQFALGRHAEICVKCGSETARITNLEYKGSSVDKQVGGSSVLRYNYIATRKYLCGNEWTAPIKYNYRVAESDLPQRESETAVNIHIENLNVERPKKPIFCPFCGAKHDEDDTKCGSCGAGLGE